MEEWVGKIWHRVITRSARREYPQARVRLEDMRLALGVLLRALSRDGGLQIQAAAAIGNTASRTLLQRVAGADLKRQAAWREPEVLHLPDSIAVFPQQALNRDLYLWLTALGSLAPLAPEAADSVPTAPGAPADAIPPDPIRQLLTRYPALEPRYQRLLAAWQALPAVPPDAMAPLTLLPAPKVPAPAAATALAEPAPPQDSAPGQQAPGSDQRQQGERTEMPEGKSGLLLFRLESLFSWTEFLPVNRTTDDDPDDDAARAAEDLDVITVARDRQSSSHKIRLNLDLPAPDYDDLPQGEGIALPEWDYRRQQLRADHCRLQVMLPRGAQEME
ncbi:MAG TPA: hypothetical protein PLN94_16125, partial [Thiolinea sp.]|nr:hypothetical protein [Thiolinea sp.]